MVCPNCKLLLPDDAERCDCGYDFASQSVKRSHLTGDLATERMGPSLTVGDKLWGQTALEGNRAEVIKKTYLLLALAVTAGVAGGVVGANSAAMVELFSGWMGWILAMVVLNVVPRIAMALRHNPLLGVTALVVFGFVAGLVLAPVLHLASVSSPDIVQGAMILTVTVFCAVTFYVMTTQKTFSAPRALMTGIFLSIIGVLILNGFLQIGLLGMLLAAAIGIFGVFILVYATSDVLNNPELESPIPGAVMLFAGLFHVFVGVINLLRR